MLPHPWSLMTNQTTNWETTKTKKRENDLNRLHLTYFFFLFLSLFSLPFSFLFHVLPLPALRPRVRRIVPTCVNE